MSADQTSAELTTRDVLLQVDRRLTLIEGDLRSLNDKFDGLDDNLDNKIDGLRAEMYAQFGVLRNELGTRLDANLKWTIGTLVTLAGLIAVVFKL